MFEVQCSKFNVRSRHRLCLSPFGGSFYDREADPCAWVLFARVKPLKERKELSELAHRYTNAVVSHSQPQEAVVSFGPGFHLGSHSAGDKFDRIGKQIDDDEMERGRIGKDHAFNAGEIHYCLLAFRLSRKIRQRLCGDDCKFHGHDGQVALTEADMGQEVIDETSLTLGCAENPFGIIAAFGAELGTEVLQQQARLTSLGANRRL